MRRTLAALVAATALGVPATAADAVTVCPGVGGTRPTFVCVGVELNGSGNTVNPELRVGCIIAGSLMCATAPIQVGTTGIDSGGHVVVAGRVIL